MHSRACRQQVISQSIFTLYPLQSQESLRGSTEEQFPKMCTMLSLSPAAGSTVSVESNLQFLRAQRLSGSAAVHRNAGVAATCQQNGKCPGSEFHLGAAGLILCPVCIFINL